MTLLLTLLLLTQASAAPAAAVPPPSDNAGQAPDAPAAAPSDAPATAPSAAPSEPPPAAEDDVDSPKRAATLLPLAQWSQRDFSDLPYTGTLLEAFLLEGGGAPSAFRNDLFSLVIAMGNAIGSEEEPTRALEKAHAYFEKDLRFQANEAAPSLDAVLPAAVLAARRGTPVLVATFFLALLDRQTFAGERAARFSLDAVLVPGGLLTRYRHGPYHVTIAPGNGGLLSDRAAQERWPVPAEDRAAGLSFRTLSRSELAGLLLAELARAHGAAGNEALEERYWRAAASFFPDGIDIRLRLARVLLRTGQAADAESHIAEVVRQCPRRGDGHFLNGVALFALGRDEEAQRAFEEALERGHSEDGKLWLYLARLAAKRRSIEELREDLIRFRETSGREDLAAEIEAVLDELRVAEAVRMATSHGPYEGRFRAVRFLGQRPTPAGKEALIRCLEDPNLRFRAYAWETLCAIAGERFPLEPQAWWRWLARQSDAKGMALWSELDVGPLPDGM